MSGHSKWHNIRLRKAAVDAGKAKIFAKLAREIIIAARAGGGDPEANPRLRTAVDKARAASMPNDNIERAIGRGTGGGDGAAYEEVVYEGYGIGGVALYIQAATDNRNRTVADLRHILSRYGGSLGESGCVSWLFERKGQIMLNGEGVDEDRLLELALEAGAEDVHADNGTFEVLTAPEDIDRVRTVLEGEGHEPVQAEILLMPKSTVPLQSDQAKRMIKLMQALEELDDVQRVNANFDIPDELLESSE